MFQVLPQTNGRSSLSSDLCSDNELHLEHTVLIMVGKRTSAAAGFIHRLIGLDPSDIFCQCHPCQFLLSHKRASPLLPHAVLEGPLSPTSNILEAQQVVSKPCQQNMILRLISFFKCQVVVSSPGWVVRAASRHHKEP